MASDGRLVLALRYTGMRIGDVTALERARAEWQGIPVHAKDRNPGLFAASGFRAQHS